MLLVSAGVGPCQRGPECSLIKTEQTVGDKSTRGEGRGTCKLIQGEGRAISQEKKFNTSRTMDRKGDLIHDGGELGLFDF